MTARRDEATVALEQVFAKGVTHLTIDELNSIVSTIPQPHKGDVLRVVGAIIDGSQQPESLIAVFNDLRRQTIKTLQPPSFNGTNRGGKQLERRLNEINLAAGAKARKRRTSVNLLERLEKIPAHFVADPISRCSDVSLLWCLVRAGRIAERRAAVRRIGLLILGGTIDDEGLDIRDLQDGLVAIRDPRIAFEVDSALSAIQGSMGRPARQRLTRVDRLLAKVTRDARNYWAGDSVRDPLLELSREELLRLGVWLRRGSDDLAAHVAEHLRFFLVQSEVSRLSDTIGAMIPSGDERLVPALRRVLADGPLAARIATARALGRIADPRVHPALLKAFRHATDFTEKTVLGGALGQHGDPRALEFLLGQLDENEPAFWEEIVRSLGSIGSRDAAEPLLKILNHDRSTVVRAVAKALVRCGGPQELKLLRQHAARRPQHGSILSDAADALALRLQLLGQLTDEEEPRVLPLTPRSRQDQIVPIETTEPATVQRLQSICFYLLGLMWSALWQRSRALDAFGAAARIHPKSASPHLHEASIHSANKRDDRAIESYRQALIANRRWVLRRPTWVQRLLKAYLRRADTLVARRRKKEALALLDEVAGLDLRMADLDLRLAMTRRRDKLLVDRARRRLIKR